MKEVINMNNKISTVGFIAGSVIVALFLGYLKDKRDKKDEEMTKESMDKVKEILDDAFEKPDFT